MKYEKFKYEISFNIKKRSIIMNEQEKMYKEPRFDFTMLLSITSEKGSISFCEKFVSGKGVI